MLLQYVSELSERAPSGLTELCAWYCKLSRCKMLMWKLLLGNAWKP